MSRRKSPPSLRAKPQYGGNAELSLAASVCPVLREFSLHWIGIKECSPQYRSQGQSPVEYSLSVISAGVGRILVNGEWREVTAGQAVVFPLGALRAFRTESSSWQYASIVYRTSPGTVPPASFSKLRIVEVDADPIMALVRMICREWLASAEQTNVHHLLHVLHHHVQRAAESRQGGRLLLHLWDTVNADLARPWDVQILSELAGMSVSTLNRLCQRELKCSPMDHVMRLRMGRAWTLLASDETNVSQAAQNVGYENAFAFSRAFKRVHGIAPKPFQMQQQAPITQAIRVGRVKSFHEYREAARRFAAVPFPLAAGAGEKEFVCLAIDGMLNRPFRGQEGAWLGGAALEHFRAGRRKHHGVPFVIRNKAMVFASSRSEAICDLPTRVVIPINRRVRAIYILHACGWPTERAPVAGWGLTIPGKHAAGVDIRTFRRDPAAGMISDWWPHDPAGHSENALPVIVHSSDRREGYERHLYTGQWINQAPGEIVEDLRIEVPTSASSVYAVLAITLLLG